MFDEFQLGLYEGKMNERERIIALLDTLKCKCYGDCEIVEITFQQLVEAINKKAAER
jgi:hypothetical protein